MHLCIILCLSVFYVLLILFSMKQCSKESLTLTFPVGEVNETYDSMEFMSSYQAYNRNLMAGSGRSLLYAFFADTTKQVMANKYFFLVTRDYVRPDSSLRNSEAESLLHNVLLPLLGYRDAGDMTALFGRSDKLGEEVPKTMKLVDYHRDIVEAKGGYGPSNAIIRKAMPYARLLDYRQDDQKVYTCFAFDTMCFADSAISPSSQKFWTGVFDGYFLTNSDLDQNRAALNLYEEVGFPVIQPAEEGEGFSDILPPVTLVLDSRISLKMVDYSKFKYRKFLFNKSNYKGLKLLPDDIVELKNQEFSYQNCKLYMFDHQTGATGLKLEWDDETMELRDQSLLLIKQRNVPARLKNFCVHVPGVPEVGDLTGEILQISKDLVICVCTPDFERHKEDMVCMKEGRVLDKVFDKRVCDVYDGLWDRKCVSDTECPFFTPGEHWGCLNGYCQMPLNVENNGYRHAVSSDTSYPMVCDGVVDPDSARACFHSSSSRSPKSSSSS